MSKQKLVGERGEEGSCSEQMIISNGDHRLRSPGESAVVMGENNKQIHVECSKLPTPPGTTTAATHPPIRRSSSAQGHPTENSRPFARNLVEPGRVCLCITAHPQAHLCDRVTTMRRLLEMTSIILLVLFTLLDISAVNVCLDTTDADRCEIDADGQLDLYSCGITDADFDDLASCLEDAGPEAITYLSLSQNELTTLPEGIFGGLTALEALSLSQNELTTLPEGIFGGLTALEYL
ncbi:unnamed protein product [Ectocarpus sp. CCAP 1310/34]|nr:unnamed protein product [Ectocarpus sp. CCAP 1310/34]